MKEYKSTKAKALHFPKFANDEAKDDWRVLIVLPAQYMPAVGTQGLQLDEILIIFERDHS